MLLSNNNERTKHLEELSVISTLWCVADCGGVFLRWFRLKMFRFMLSNICYQNKYQRSFSKVKFLFKFMFRFMFEVYLKTDRN